MSTYFHATAVRRYPAISTNRLAVHVVAALLPAVALIFAGRRLAGALTTPLETPMLLAIGALLVLAARTIHRFSDSLSLRVTASMALVGAAAALSLPGTSPVGLVIFWALPVVEEAWAWTVALRSSNAPVESQFPSTGSPRLSMPSQVVQQITRLRTTTGDDVLEAQLHAEFAPGQRNVTVHVAFCPPFALLPQIDFEQTAGPEARVRVGQLLPQGVRLDLKLGSPGPASVDVALSAFVSAAQSKS